MDTRTRAEPNRRRRRAPVVAAATAVAIVGLLAACSSSGSTTLGPASSSAPQSSLKPKGGCPADATVSLWQVQATTSQETPDKDAIASFKKVCPGITINVQYYTSANLKQKLIASFAAGNPPTMFETTGPQIPSYLALGKTLVSLGAGLSKYNPSWKSEIIPSALSAQTSGGSLYAFPSYIPGPLMLFYNKTVFDQVGVSAPKTIAQLESVSKKLAAAGKIPVALGDQDKFPGTYWLQYLIARNGGTKALQNILDKKPDAWSAPAVKAGLTQIRQLAEDGVFGKGYDTTGAANNADKTLFYTGSAGMILSGAYALGSFEQADPALLEKNQLGYTAFPSAASASDADNLTIFGVPSEVYAVTAKSTTAQQNAAEAYMATQMATKAYGKARIAIGDVPAVSGLESAFPTGNEGQVGKFAYATVQKSAAEFESNWFDALGSNGTTFEDNSASVINGSMTPEEFIAQMNKTL